MTERYVHETFITVGENTNPTVNEPTLYYQKHKELVGEMMFGQPKHLAREHYSDSCADIGYGKRIDKPPSKYIILTIILHNKNRSTIPIRNKKTMEIS